MESHAQKLLLRLNRCLLPIAGLILLGMSIIGCTAEPKPTITGSWRVDLFGDCSGKMPLTIRNVPEELKSALDLIVETTNTHYQLEGSVNEQGKLMFTVLDQGKLAGFIQGELDETGHGAGTYQIHLHRDEQFFTLNGQWDASKN